LGGVLQCVVRVGLICRIWGEGQIVAANAPDGSNIRR
jgi:hypothetical protein